MQIRTANIEGAEELNRLYLQAFDKSEAESASKIAVSLLFEQLI